MSEYQTNNHAPVMALHWLRFPEFEAFEFTGDDVQDYYSCWMQILEYPELFIIGSR